MISSNFVENYKHLKNKTMKQKNLCIRIIRLILLNAKWIMLGILLLNLFVFGYWNKINERGLGDEETFWGIVIIVALIVCVIFDRGWKQTVNKICDSI